MYSCVLAIGLLLSPNPSYHPMMASLDEAVSPGVKSTLHQQPTAADDSAMKLHLIRSIKTRLLLIQSSFRTLLIAEDIIERSQKRANNSAKMSDDLIKKALAVREKQHRQIRTFMCGIVDDSFLLLKIYLRKRPCTPNAPGP